MATTLLQLLGGKGVVEDAVIRRLTVDSRTVGAGDMFVALPGTKVDGRAFIADAIRQGASAILTSEGSAQFVPEAGVPVIEVANPRQRYAQLASRFYGEQPAFEVAVTGTNGKTSVADFTRQIWQQLGTEAASIGTLGVRSNVLATDGGLTSPDPMVLHQNLSMLKQAGVDHVAVEASSHGLHQYRLDGMSLSAAAFTNLTRDHLDYHKTEQAYFYAKARLFGELLPPSGSAVINIDDSWGAIIDDIAWGRSLDRFTFGRQSGARLQLASVEPSATGQNLDVKFEGATFTTQLPLVGDFQAMNVLTAAGLVLSSGFAATDVFATLANLRGVPGRMELMGSHNDAGVFVDYAHTPDGLKTVLCAARAHNPARLHVVFGCGGDRDTGKRPQMGAIAARYADTVYITDDNPRSEDPAAIREDILAASPGANEIADRSAAIAAALEAAKPGDMVIVAGKGHETGQIIGDQTINYSDIEAVQTLLGAGTANQAMTAEE